jgi:hypothetical protein
LLLSSVVGWRSKDGGKAWGILYWQGRRGHADFYEALCVEAVAQSGPIYAAKIGEEDDGILAEKRRYGTHGYLQMTALPRQAIDGIDE